ncbi:MAG TPA: non-heme iron oxygenase ferredoxin subunit [Nocardioides sp.]|nr:non-heme iron oxygenase ferredoxin subunit [Nocardioides sp.]
MESAQTVKRRFACIEGALAPGESMTVPADADDSVDIALYRNDAGEYYATADTCTHEDWSLGEDSDLEGNEVVCPLHLARFDITTGAALCFPATIALATFEVVCEDGKVYVL